MLDGHYTFVYLEHLEHANSIFYPMIYRLNWLWQSGIDLRLRPIALKLLLFNFRLYLPAVNNGKVDWKSYTL